jgi:hypothetical protein
MENTQKTETPFGYKGALYLEKPLGNYHPDLHLEQKKQKVIELIVKYNDSAKYIVDSVKKRHNSIITESLKDVTGLKLKHKGVSSYNKVTIDIVTSIPPRLMDALMNTELVIIELILKLGPLNESEEILSYLLINYDVVSRNLGTLSDVATIDEINNTHGYLQVLIHKIAESELYKQLKTLSIDNLLGAYFYYQNKVELYWPALSFYASWKRIPLYDLAFIVLAHEKAHVITHLGLDLDGQQWSTVDFNDCDIKIVEGLAQHYTQHVCNVIESSNTLKDTFETLLKDQSEPYKCFLNWLEGQSGRDEKIRLTMLNTRKSHIKSYDLFLEELKNSSKNIKSK